MDIIQELGIENLKIVSYYTKGTKTEKSKLAFRVTADNPMQKYPELFILNAHFLKMQKKEAENIRIEFSKVQDRLDLEPNEKAELSFFEQSLRSLFLDYIYKKEIANEIKAELELHKCLPREFPIRNNKSPFGVQITEKNAKDDVTLALYTSKNSNLDSKKELLFSQVRTALIKSKVICATYTINLTKLENNMLDILSISAYGKDIIKEGGGILYVLTHDKKLKGMYEIVNL